MAPKFFKKISKMVKNLNFFIIWARIFKFSGYIDFGALISYMLKIYFCLGACVERKVNIFTYLQITRNFKTLPMWASLCLRRLSLLLKDLSQSPILQGNGLAPEWIRRCAFKLPVIISCCLFEVQVKCYGNKQQLIITGNLKAHLLIHSGARPFPCNIGDCDKSFRSNESLRRHKLAHMGNVLKFLVICK
jgi:hypothetical protein